MGIRPLMAFSNISSVLRITFKKLLNLSTSWSRKLLIEGKIFSSSPKRCSGITDLSMFSGNEEKTAIVSRVLSSMETDPPPFGSSN